MHVRKEKTRIDIDMDKLIQETLEIFNKKRKELHNSLDDYLHAYKKNYQILNYQCTAFKEKQKQINPCSEANSFANLVAVSYLRNNNEIIKTEKCNI